MAILFFSLIVVYSLFYQVKGKKVLDLLAHPIEQQLGTEDESR